MTSLLSLLGRGAVAGGAAGFVSGGFSWLLAEPVLDKAVRLEATREEASGGPAGVELFSRSTQHTGLLIAAVLTGASLGVLFAVVYAIVHRRDPESTPWQRSLMLAGAGFTGVWLLPFLRYPANPPGVGDPGTLDTRVNAWLAAIGIGVIAVTLAWRVHGWLKQHGRSAPQRQLAVMGIVLAALVSLFALPDNPDPVTAPALLVWDFRALSAASMGLLWGGLAVGFGLLGMRAARDRTEAGLPSASSAVPAT
ncbi:MULTISPECIES: CbtA family protein [Streptomyces]|uniref:CbtA family protein n=1 Tax=Streptomyces TaxID=1883 RepID=UPI0019A790EA|nr:MULTISPECIES: CbtA family protein [Streptomyces]GGZ73151.1 membrane protein [Streptomyces plicatus]GHC27866.1 membrane protein [Streptomyces vinaceusdrappus]